MLDTLKALIAALFSSIKTYKWFWAGGAGAAVAVAVALVLIFGDFFGPSGRTICQIARHKAVAYGVLPASAQLQDDGTATEVEGRRACAVTADGESFVVTAELVCKDIDKDIAALKDEKPDAKKADDKKKDESSAAGIYGNFEVGCFRLYAVERADGLSAYQFRQVPDDGEEVAAQAAAGQGGEGEGEGAAPADDGSQAAKYLTDVEVAKPAGGGE